MTGYGRIMDRKRWAALTVAAAAAVAIGVWVGLQSFASGSDDTQVPDDAPASSPDPDYWDSERMQDATPAPMPTVD